MSQTLNLTLDELHELTGRYPAARSSIRELLRPLVGDTIVHMDDGDDLAVEIGQIRAVGQEDGDPGGPWMLLDHWSGSGPAQVRRFSTQRHALMWLGRAPAGTVAGLMVWRSHR